MLSLTDWANIYLCGTAPIWKISLIGQTTDLTGTWLTKWTTSDGPTNGSWHTRLVALKEMDGVRQAPNLRLGPWILMGSFDLTSVWEHCWHMQSFPLNVTLSPMGKGLLRSEKKTSWQQEDKTCLQWVWIYILINTNTLCNPGEAIIKQWGEELIRCLFLQEHVTILWLRRRWCYAVTCFGNENVLSQCWWEKGLVQCILIFTAFFSARASLYGSSPSQQVWSGHYPAY